MARDGIKWLDSDMHLAEPAGLWQDYVEAKYQDVAPRWTPRYEGDHPMRGVRAGWDVAGNSGSLFAADDPNDPDTKMALERFEWMKPFLNDQGFIGPEGQQRAMDVEGIDVAVLFPSTGNLGQTVTSVGAELCLAFARAYNTWLADFCQGDPQRLKHNAIIPVLDIDQALSEIERAVRAYNSVSIFPMIQRPGSRRLDDPWYEPIWRTAEANNLTIAFHGARGGHFRDRYKDSVPLAYVNGRGIEHALSFSELLYGGVLERHPGLNFVFLEAGCSWVVYWLSRLEEVWERFRRYLPDLADNVKMPAVEYWKRQCYTSVEVEEWTLPEAISAAGDDNFVVSSDFPHSDSSFPHARDHFMQIARVSEESKRKILWDNCARLYHLN